MSNCLQHKVILVTRPQAQQQSLCDRITAAGGIAFALPAIEILPLEFALGATQQAQTDLLIFCSRNAVTYSLPQLHTCWQSLPPCIGIGSGTAAELQKHGQPCIQHGGEQANSEALLRLPLLTQVQQKQILIVQAADGRTLLADTLTARGASVRTIVAYRTTVPQYQAEPLCSRWRQQPPHYILASSGKILENLIELIPAVLRPQLLATPLVVFGERCRKRAQELGYHASVSVAAGTSDEGFMQTLRQMLTAAELLWPDDPAAK